VPGPCPEAIAVVPVLGLCAIRRHAIRLCDRSEAEFCAVTVRIMVEIKTGRARQSPGQRRG